MNQQALSLLNKHYQSLKQQNLKIMEIKYEETSYYGQTKLNKHGDSIKHGLGGLYYNNGRFYEGEWSNGHRHGHGFEKFDNGNTYEGQYHKGKADGKGTYKWRYGEIYTGQWNDGLRNGKGKW